MDNLQKQTWHDRLLAVVWASCGILPLPFGAFASDRPYIASASILALFYLILCRSLVAGLSTPSCGQGRRLCVIRGDPVWRRRRPARRCRPAQRPDRPGLLAFLSRPGRIIRPVDVPDRRHTVSGGTGRRFLERAPAGNTGTPSSSIPSSTACPCRVPCWACSSSRPSATHP